MAEFVTAQPEVGGSDETFGSAGIAVIDPRAYLAENDFKFGYLRVFDLTDPTHPAMIEDASDRVFGRPMGIAAQPTVNFGTHEVAVVTGPANTSIPSNLYLFDVAGDTPENTTSKWVGAATLSSTAQEGIVWRVALHRKFAYTLTTFKGIQVVDLEAARSEFEGAGGDTSPMRIAFNADGQGWGQQYVVATIPVLKENERPAFLSDLKVGDFVVNGFTQAVVLAVGEFVTRVPGPEGALVIADPFSGTTRLVPLTFTDGSGGRPIAEITWGYAIALGRAAIAGPDGELAERDIAVVSGTGKEHGISTSLLMVIDLSDISQPLVLGYLPLAKATDVALYGTQAFVGDTDRIRVVDLTYPTAMQVVAEVLGTGGWIAVANIGGAGVVAYSTGRSIEAGHEASNGGVRSTILAPQRALASLLTPTVVFPKLIDNSVHTECPSASAPVVVDVYRTAEISLLADGLPLKGYREDQGCDSTPMDLNLVLGEGRHVLRVSRNANLLFAAGSVSEPAFRLVAQDPYDRRVVHQEIGQFVERVENPPVLPVGHVIVKGVDLTDGHLVKQATDINIPGRNLDLHVTRTYTSADPSTVGPLGPGWTWNYAASLQESRACNCVNVRTADGTSQLFHTTDNWQTFTPEKGYHTRLNAVSRVVSSNHELHSRVRVHRQVGDTPSFFHTVCATTRRRSRNLPAAVQAGLHPGAARRSNRVRVRCLSPAARPPGLRAAPGLDGWEFHNRTFPARLL